MSGTATSGDMLRIGHRNPVQTLIKQSVNGNIQNIIKEDRAI